MRYDRTTLSTTISGALLLVVLPMSALAQTGVDDDRVSLPEGPGSLEGIGDNAEIDLNMGSMRYSVRITTPQGRNGMAPDLTMSYSSAAGAGLLGIGWSMQASSNSSATASGRRARR